MASLEELGALYKRERDLLNQHLEALNDIKTAFSQVYPIGSKATFMGHTVTIRSQAMTEQCKFPVVRVMYDIGVLETVRADSISPLETTK